MKQVAGQPLKDKSNNYKSELCLKTFQDLANILQATTSFATLLNLFLTPSITQNPKSANKFRFAKPINNNHK